MYKKDEKKTKDIDFSLHQRLVNELEARDTVFRIKFNSKKRKSHPSFITDQCPYHEKHMSVWNRLSNGDITEEVEVALEEITQLMEEYYGEKYFLNL